MKLFSNVFLFVLVGTLLAADASARVSLISPMLLDLSDHQSVSLGSMQPGETLELFFNRKSGTGSDWDSLSVSNVPSGWTVSPAQVLPESIGVRIAVPASQPEAVQSLSFVFSGNGSSETVNLSLTVKNGLLAFAVVPSTNHIKLGQSAVFAFRVVNQSLAPHSFVISSTLPDSSFKPVTLSLDGAGSDKSAQDRDLVVTPNTYGHRDFSFRMTSNLNAKTLDVFNETLTVDPTLGGKYRAGAFGLPVLVPSLNVFYFFNAFIGLLQ